ncbi:hypothetical protein C8F04DRAFT_1180712 [Mycena alexandri]|uniref:Uncharacterized protein n=1 Tax=Mycena alexandri TaxID=1745969 RepID=A0AAD6T0B2_9AGAR|nr:hypothetical protein C8F04DRAFT_1180712 [Mycena alexandri]
MATQRSQYNPLAIEARGRVLVTQRGFDVVMNQGIPSVDPGLSYLSIPGYPIHRSRVILSTVGNKPEVSGLFPKRKNSAAFARIMTVRKAPKGVHAEDLPDGLRTTVGSCCIARINSNPAAQRERLQVLKLFLGLFFVCESEESLTPAEVARPVVLCPDGMFDRTAC